MHLQVCPHRSQRVAWRSFGRMGSPSAAAASRRDTVNELYDCAGQLVQAARELGVAVARSGTAPALAATLGCLEASLEALAQCIDSVRARIHEQLPPTGFSAFPSREVPLRTSRSFGRSSIRPPAPPVRHEGPSGRSSQTTSQPELRRFRTGHRATLRPQSRPRRSPSARPRRVRQPSRGDRERPPRSPISLHRPSRDPVTWRRRATSGQTPMIRRGGLATTPSRDECHRGPICAADPMGRHDVKRRAWTRCPFSPHMNRTQLTRRPSDSSRPPLGSLGSTAAEVTASPSPASRALSLRRASCRVL
jgi:hypothetical protein